MAEKSKITRTVTQDNFVTEKIDVIQNNLLGIYEDDGDYKISPQIVKELLSLHKVKRTTFANSVFCVGNLLGYGELVFELTFDSKTHNGKSASATLYLLEDVDKINGYLQNTIKTELEVFNEVVENFIEETYKHFNIDSEEDDDAEVLERKLDEDLDNEDSFIIAKKQYSLMLEKLLEEKFLDAYGKYFTSRISALTKIDNDFTRAVLGSFNNQYALIQNVFLQEKNYKILNELLDKCFEEKTAIKPEFIAQEQEYSRVISPALETFVDSVNKLNDRFEPKARHLLGKDDRKKVEELLEEHAEMEASEVEYDDVKLSKQTAENMVNDIPKNVYTMNNENTQHTDSKEKTSETHFIEEIINKKSNEAEQTQVENNDANFYNAFKEHRASQTNKVVDTSRSEYIDSSPREEIAVSSLNDRMNRLAKFKDQSASLETNDFGESATTVQRDKDDRVSNLFDSLAKAKERKVEQFDIRNRRNRAEVDSIGLEQEDLMTQRQREELLRNQYRDFDMEK